MVLTGKCIHTRQDLKYIHIFKVSVVLVVLSSVPLWLVKTSRLSLSTTLSFLSNTWSTCSSMTPSTVASTVPLKQRMVSSLLTVTKSLLLLNATPLKSLGDKPRPLTLLNLLVVSFNLLLRRYSI